MIIQGREIIPKDIEFIREMIKAHPSWGRTKLSKELAVLWNWRAGNGQLKDRAYFIGTRLAIFTLIVAAHFIFGKNEEISLSINAIMIDAHVF